LLVRHGRRWPSTKAVRQAEPTKTPLANLALLAPWRRSRKWIT
jgi:hypothetical protein